MDMLEIHRSERELKLRAKLLKARRGSRHHSMYFDPWEELNEHGSIYADGVYARHVVPTEEVR